MPVMILTGLLIIASLYDIRMKKIPVWLAVMHLLSAVLALAMDMFIDGLTISDYAMTFMVILLIISVAVIMKLTETDAIGSADGLLMITVCMVIKAEKAILVFGSAFILAGLSSGVLMMMRRAGRKSRIPFIPFLTAGLLLCLILTDSGEMSFI